MKFDGLLPVLHLDLPDLALEPVAIHELVDFYHRLLPAILLRTKAHDTSDRVDHACDTLDRAERDAVVAALRRGVAHGRE